MIRLVCRALLLVGLAGVVAACDGGEGASGSGAVSGTIEGVVVYRERMALPPQAVVEVLLEDISRPDAPATELAVSRASGENGPPYPFVLEYDPERIEPGHTYALRAIIRVDGKMVFTTTDYTSPFAGNPVEVLVRRVPGDN